ncbi:Protein of unknown function, partial [Gryllus bimaculatus]
RVTAAPWRAQRWVYVGDEELREYPLGALQAAAAAAAGATVMVVDADLQLDAARALVASVSSRLQVVFLSSGHAAGIATNGRPLALRALEGAWPGLRGGVGGAALAALARGRAVALGAAPEEPPVPCLYVARVLEHPPALDAAVLRALRPEADLL